MNYKIIFTMTAASLLAACGSTQVSSEGIARKVVDRSYEGSRPAWAGQTKIRWEEQDHYVVKSGFTIMGNQRTTHCYDSAKFEAKEALLSEVANEISGEINLASEGADEASGNYITKVLLENIKGDTRGLKIQEQFYERFRIQDTERIECYMLSSIKKSDYQAIKDRALSKLSKTNIPELQKALQDRQMRLISSDTKNKTESKKSQKDLIQETE